MSLVSALNIKQSFRKRFADWVTRHHRVVARETSLNRRRLYILPTSYGLYFASLLILMLLAAMNYSNSMAFMLTFLLAGIGHNAMWYTHRNLLNLQITKGNCAPVHAGDDASFKLTIYNPTAKPRHAIVLQWEDHEYTCTDIPAGESVHVDLKVHASKRGRLYPGRFKIYTRFPLGMFQAWSWVNFDMSCLVYPSPVQSSHSPNVSASGEDGEEQRGEGRDDYNGMRSYQASDSPRHIAWKVAARHEDLLTKQFSGQTNTEIWLDWQQLQDLDIEQRLSILCHWILQMRTQQQRFGMRIPGFTAEPAMGEEHEQRCLLALALYGNHDDQQIIA